MCFLQIDGLEGPAKGEDYKRGAQNSPGTEELAVAQSTPKGMHCARGGLHAVLERSVPPQSVAQRHRTVETKWLPHIHKHYNMLRYRVSS